MSLLLQADTPQHPPSTPHPAVGPCRALCTMLKLVRFLCIYANQRGACSGICALVPGCRPIEQHRSTFPSLRHQMGTATKGTSPPCPARTHGESSPDAHCRLPLPFPLPLSPSPTYRCQLTHGASPTCHHPAPPSRVPVLVPTQPPPSSPSAWPGRTASIHGCSPAPRS